MPPSPSLISPIQTENEELLAAARAAAANAHAPYSKFHVGAAALCEDGTVIPGCNVENASYGLTNCAERTALFSAVAAGKRVARLAVSCVDVSPGAPVNLLMPCGACRQVISELLPGSALIVIDQVGEIQVKDLLPLAFHL